MLDIVGFWSMPSPAQFSHIYMHCMYLDLAKARLASFSVLLPHKQLYQGQRETYPKLDAHIDEKWVNLIKEIVLAEIGKGGCHFGQNEDSIFCVWHDILQDIKVVVFSSTNVVAEEAAVVVVRSSSSG